MRPSAPAVLVGTTVGVGLVVGVAAVGEGVGAASDAVCTGWDVGSGDGGADVGDGGPEVGAAAPEQADTASAAIIALARRCFMFHSLSAGSSRLLGH